MNARFTLVPEKMEVYITGILVGIVIFGVLAQTGIIIWWAVERVSTTAAYVNTAIICVIVIFGAIPILLWFAVELIRRLKKPEGSIPHPSVQQLKDSY